MRGVKEEIGTLQIYVTVGLLLLWTILLASASPVSAWDPSEERRNILWHDLLGTKKLQELSTGEGVVVAVLDTGVDLENPRLSRRLWRNSGEIEGDGIDNDRNGYVDDVSGWDFGDRDSDPMDENGHGTAVGSILLDTAPGVILMPLKINRRGGGLFDTEDLVEAVRYAVDNRARVINLSLAVETGIDLLASAIRSAVERGVLVVAAAGNPGGTFSFPASMEETLAVGAMDDPQSDVGDVYSPEALPDLVAPGADVEFIGLGGNIETGSGSSLSAPMAAGAAAVLMAMNPFLKAKTVRHLLTAGTVDPGKDSVYGCGALNGRALYDVGVPRIILRDKAFPEITQEEKISVDIYLPPTDTPSLVYVAMAGENEIWWLDAMGNWADLSAVPAEPLARLTARSTALSGTLFGDKGIFPPFGPFPKGSCDHWWGTAVVDESGLLLGPITWTRMPTF